MSTVHTNKLLPMFITAKTLEGLRRSMIEVNKFYNKDFNFDWNFANGEYVALYQLDIHDLEKLAREGKVVDKTETNKVK